jgi:hypothetical protein
MCTADALPEFESTDVSSEANRDIEKVARVIRGSAYYSEREVWRRAVTFNDKWRSFFRDNWH